MKKWINEHDNDRNEIERILALKKMDSGDAMMNNKQMIGKLKR